MKWALFISGIIELLGGLILYFQPELIFSFTENIHFSVKLYALTIIILGILNLIAWRSFDMSMFFRQFFITMMGFHAAVAFMSYAAPLSQFPLQLTATICHVGVFIIFLVTYMKDA